MSHALKRLARESVSWTNPEINVQAKTYMKNAQKVIVFDVCNSVTPDVVEGLLKFNCRIKSEQKRFKSKNKKKIRFLKIKKVNSNFSF